MNKEKFKEFVRSHPALVKHVKNNEMTWQKFYEMYDLYGEENEVWNDYIEKKESPIKTTTEAGAGLDFVSWLKNIDLDALQDNINSVKRVVGVLQDFGSKDSNTTQTSNYKPRPLYKHFED